MNYDNIINVVAYGDYSARQADRLQSLLGERYVVTPAPDQMSESDKAAIFERASVIVANKFGSNEPPTPNLRLLHSPSAGMEGIDVSALPSDCVVKSVGGHEIPMAEFAICSMLDWKIRYRELTSTVSEGLWTQRDWIKGPTHDEVFGTTVGLVGFGRVAQEISKRAEAFGMRRLALSRWSTGRPGKDIVDKVYSYEEWEEFVHQCDFVIITVPLEENTRSLVNSRWFEAMKQDAVIINIARGPVIDEEALYQALKSKNIGGAIIDVWYNYPNSETIRVPLASYPFHELDNLVVSPHGSGRTPQMFNRRWREISKNIENIEIRR